MTENQKARNVLVKTQYVRNLSFENPNFLSIIGDSNKPDIKLSVNVNINKLDSDDDYEVGLIIEANATISDKTMFVVELDYAGIFHLANFSAEELDPALGIYCPTVIFPFARAIIANVTRDSGMQPLMIDPIDFGAMYHKEMLNKNKQK